LTYESRQPRSGFHEFQYSLCAGSSNPDSIAACDGSVDACLIVRAVREYDPSRITNPWIEPLALSSASGRSPSSLMMITWRATCVAFSTGVVAGGAGFAGVQVTDETSSSGAGPS
jgi:hypothetical protein